MTYKYGKRSLKNRETLHSDLQRLLDEVLKFYDFTILFGYRTNERRR